MHSHQETAVQQFLRRTSILRRWLLAFWNGKQYVKAFNQSCLNWQYGAQRLAETAVSPQINNTEPIALQNK